MIKACKISDCKKPAGVPGTAKSLGLCSMHYTRFRRNGDPNIRSQRIYTTHLPCTVEGCTNNIAGKGLCKTHWTTARRQHDPPGAHHYRKDYWMSHEIEHLIQILNRSKDGLAYARPGELVHLAIIMRTRSVVAIRSRLHHLRTARKAAQNRAILTTE